MEISEQTSVLVVDDEVKFLEYTARYLRTRNIDCDTSSSGSECLKLLANKKYHVILTDIVMPDNSDLGIVTRIHACAPETPIILMTAFPSLDSAVAAANSPIFSYVLKPLDMPEVLGLIVAAAARSKMLGAAADLRTRLGQWISDLDAVRESASHRQVKGAPVPVETFLSLGFSNVVSTLMDLHRLMESMTSDNKERSACHLMECPRLNEQLGIIQHTVGVLESTRRSFKSKELGELRQKLEWFLEKKVSHSRVSSPQKDEEGTKKGEVLSSPQREE